MINEQITTSGPEDFHDLHSLLGYPINQPQYWENRTQQPYEILKDPLVWVFLGKYFPHIGCLSTVSCEIGLLNF